MVLPVVQTRKVKNIVVTDESMTKPICPITQEYKLWDNCFYLCDQIQHVMFRHHIFYYPYFPWLLLVHCSPVIGSSGRLIICLSRVWPTSGKINSADNSTRLAPGRRFINVQNSPQNAIKINNLQPHSLSYPRQLMTRQIQIHAPRLYPVSQINL